MTAAIRASVEPQSSIPALITAPPRSFFDTRVLNTAGLDLTSAVRDHPRDTRPDNQNARPSQTEQFPTTLTLRPGEIGPDTATEDLVFWRNRPKRARCPDEALSADLRPLKFSTSKVSPSLPFALSTYPPGP